MTRSGRPIGEERQYGSVEQFLRNELNCAWVNRKVGFRNIGFADVYGVREVGGAFKQVVETISVEVKTRRGPFLNFLGQALGYSLFSHRCFLAMKREGKFSPEEIEMASRLGVGLIRIGRPFSVVLGSQKFQPNENLLLGALSLLGLWQCNICGMLFSSKKWTARSPQQAVRENKAFSSWEKQLRGDRMEPLFEKRAERGRWRLNICAICLTKLQFHKIPTRADY